MSDNRYSEKAVQTRQLAELAVPILAGLLANPKCDRPANEEQRKVLITEALNYTAELVNQIGSEI